MFSSKIITWKKPSTWLGQKTQSYRIIRGRAENRAANKCRSRKLIMH